MGVEVVVGGADAGELEAVRRLFAQWEATFSRFLPDSELSRVNSCTSGTIVVSPLFARVLETALWAARVSGDLVVPTIGGALLAAGYDRDFSVLGEPGGACSHATPSAGQRFVRIVGRVLSRPPGVVLDLNGVVKGLAVDEASRLVPGGFVSAGGDIATTTPIEAGLPDGGSVRMAAGGLATSGTTRRRWTRDGVLRHHLIDPRTGEPSDSRWEQVTVAAASCLAADVAAKAAFLLSDEGPDWLDARGLPGRFVAAGEVVVNESWGRAVPSDPPMVSA